jgi:succinate dehydrogenase / fumarate reductase iron-sulfur subunit
MDAEGFGYCTNHGACEAACPKAISLVHIAQLNRDHLLAALGKGIGAERAESGAG